MGREHSNRRDAGRRATRNRALGALVAAGALSPLPAAAQQGQGYAVVQGQILDSFTVQNNGQMNFGTISPGTANGTVVMVPSETSTAGTCTTTSGIVHTGLCRTARFEGSLPFVFNLQITRPVGNQVTLSGPSGATILLHDFTFARGSTWMFGNATNDTTYLVLFGNFVIYVGGTIDVARTQRAGVYTGSFTIKFNYN